jgi:hypothetical protein
MQISGTMRIGEGTATHASISKRTSGSSPDSYTITAGLAVFGTIAGYLIGIPDRSFGALFGGFTGLVLHYPVYRWLAMRNWRKCFAEKYPPGDLPFSVECTPEALIYEFGMVKRITQWPVVSDLFCAGNYWIFLAQGSALLVPFKAFGDREAEAAFLKLALSFMSEPARARSEQAVHFAKGAGA